MDKFVHLYATQQCSGDVDGFITSDFQPPTELIRKLIEKWNKKITRLFSQKKNSSDELFFINKLRSLFYLFLRKASKLKLIANITGEGIYDKDVIEIFKKNKDPSFMPWYLSWYWVWYIRFSSKIERIWKI